MVSFVQAVLKLSQDTLPPKEERFGIKRGHCRKRALQKWLGQHSMRETK